ncbi:MAG: hypothetical protein II007_01275 [Gammaproteobacteria bacterium]|nr:hypothetical protein [Gammaproteobacteria bacterium]
MANAEPEGATRGTDPLATSAPALVASSSALIQELAALLLDQLQLLRLQAQYTLAGMVRRVLYGVMLVVTLISAWLALLIGTVLWLLERGMNASGAVLMVVPLSLLAVVLCLLAMAPRSTVGSPRERRRPTSGRTSP